MCYCKKYYRARESKIFENISGEAYLGTEYLLAASDLYKKLFICRIIWQ